MVTLRGRVWYARIGVYDEAGKRVQKWIRLPGITTERQAKKEETRLRAEVNSRPQPTARYPFLADYIRDWLMTTAGERAAQTNDTYHCLAATYLIPQLGALRLDQLVPALLRGAYTHLRASGLRGQAGGVSEQTLLHCHRLLNQIMACAVTDGLLKTNPLAGVKAPVPARHEARFLDEAEVVRLLQACEGHRLEIPILLAVTAGLRRGEVLALRWDRMDLERGTLTVNLALEHPSTGLGYKAPKSRSSRRTVLLLPMALAALRRHQEAQARQKELAGGDYHDQNLVVAQPDGTPITPGALTQAFKLFLRRAGLPPLRFHDLRHTHVALLIKQNTSMKAISTRLGHSGIGITMNTYGHLLPGIEEEAVSRLDHTLSSLPAR